MNLESMLEKCHRGQWKVGDLDWSKKPRPMSEEDERDIVQFFTDMVAIERIAAALFDEQGKKTKNPLLREIFSTFVVDEVRHAHAAQMLADFYDVHRYQAYVTSPTLARFAPPFIELIRCASADIANAYVTAGELILDVALLRSLNDYVGDEMSQSAMNLINRDESRHIAIDFFMSEYYASPEYQEMKRHDPEIPLATRLRGQRALAEVLWYASGFFRDVMFQPMKKTDPTGKRLSEAIKRYQLLGSKPHMRATPFARFMYSLQNAYTDHASVRLFFGKPIARIMGADQSLIARLYTEAEARRAARMTVEEMAEEALALKEAS